MGTGCVMDPACEVSVAVRRASLSTTPVTGRRRPSDDQMSSDT